MTKMQAFIETRRPKVLEANKPLEEQWISTTAGNQKVNYCSKFKEIHGETSDPLTAPFDPMVAMCAGQGKLNGRPYIGGACFESSGTGGSLAEMRARRTSSAPEIERRPRVGLGRMAALEVCMSFLNLLFHYSTCFHCDDRFLHGCNPVGRT